MSRGGAFEQGGALEEKKLAPITQEQLRQYAEASGDNNPIHLDEKVAKSHGLPGVIAHGMLIAGFLAERGLEELDRRNATESWTQSGFQIRFKAMTLLGDTLALSGTVKKVSDSELVFDLVARNQRQETVAQATMSFARASV